MTAKLENLNVVLFESRHAKTIGDLVRLQGGIPHSAPAMKEVPLEQNPDAFLFAERLLRGEIHAVILLTGVGTRILVEALQTRYKKEEIIEALKKTRIVPRGPKPIRVLRELGIPYAVTVPEPNTWREILATLDANKDTVPVEGRVVALQEYGVPNPELIKGLKDRAANLLVVPVYRWALPDDTAPLKKAIAGIVEGKMQVAVFTTAIQIEHVLKVARELGLEDKLKGALSRAVVASVGPDCSEAIRSFGLPVDIEPESSKMGPLVAAVAERAASILRSKGAAPS